MSTNTQVTSAQLVEAVKAYRSLGSKVRSQVKAKVSDATVQGTLRLREALTGRLAEAGHMDLALALSSEQVALDGIAFVKATPELVGNGAADREVLRDARRKVAAILSDVEADEALATLPTEVVTELAELHMRREYSSQVFRVLGVDSEGMTLLDVRDASNELVRSVGTLIKDLWIACEVDGTPYEPDVSVMTLTELVRFRRDCAKIFRSPVRLDYSSYRWAAHFTEEVDQELYLRRQTGLRATLIQEASDIVAVEHGQRHDYVVPQLVHDSLASCRHAIEDYLVDFGHLVRD